MSSPAVALRGGVKVRSDLGGRERESTRRHTPGTFGMKPRHVLCSVEVVEEGEGQETEIYTGVLRTHCAALKYTHTCMHVRRTHLVSS